MSNGSDTRPSSIIGIIGFGAFGQLIARHIRPYFRLCAYDPAPDLQPIAECHGVALTTLEMAASSEASIWKLPLAAILSCSRPNDGRCAGVDCRCA